MSNSNLVKKASEYVRELFEQSLPDGLVYHNFDHTNEVVTAAKLLLEKSKINNGNAENVLLAAWFHDTGYIDGKKNHEERSIQVAADFLKEKGCPQEKINKVAEYIMATKFPQSPKNIEEEILCDADLHHLGKKNFFEKMNLLRIECEQQSGEFISDADWFRSSIDLFVNHNFYTRAAREEFGEQRTDNLIKLQKKSRKISEESKVSDTKLKLQKEKVEYKLRKDERPERGIETMFRITSGNHIDLSSMADHKANIMISVNTILITIVVSLLLRKLDTVNNAHLIIPTFILLSVSLLCIIFATLSTKPKITQGTFTQDDIRKKKVNLLFFGNFHNMNYDDFEWGMKEMMNDKEFLYGSMIKDFYFLGRVLGKKYKYLNICYNIFMYGMIVAILSYLIAVVSYPTTIPEL